LRAQRIDAGGGLVQQQHIRLEDEARRQGYALLSGHVHADATGIAVPVRDGLGEVVAALSVIVPNDARAVSAVPALLAAARGIGRSLR
jgi:DNA-binding IclR family transcriptional regulator